MDLDSERYTQVIDWETEDISWEGRGGDRGLRGISFYEGRIYLAASDEIFVYDNKFNKIGSIKNRYLKHCHEIHAEDDAIYLTSTGYDSVLKYKPSKDEFVKGICFRGRKNYCIRNHILDASKIVKKLSNRFGYFVQRKANEYYYSKYKGEGFLFDPKKDGGPIREDTLHINNVCVKNNIVYASGRKFGYIISENEGEFEKCFKIPKGSHNAKPLHHDKSIVNNTSEDKVEILKRDGSIIKEYNIPRYGEGRIEHKIPKDHARQAFARGLCVHNENLIIVGASPATIYVYDMEEPNPKRSVNITLDVRNSIHGLEVWPFDND